MPIGYRFLVNGIKTPFRKIVSYERILSLYDALVTFYGKDVLLEYKF